MPRTKGSTATTDTKIKLGAPKQAQESELERLRRENEELRAQQTNRGGNGGRVYAPAQTSREVAKQFTPEMLRDLGHLLVKTIPGSPKTDSNPYGTPVLVTSQRSGVKMVAMKDGVDRGDYIKIRDMVEQIVGNFWSYREPEPLSDEQIDKILRPVLDSTKQFWSEE